MHKLASLVLVEEDFHRLECSKEDSERAYTCRMGGLEVPAMVETREDASLSLVMNVGRDPNSDDYIITARAMTRSRLLTDYNKRGTS
jgi:hypothetical protein